MTDIKITYNKNTTGKYDFEVFQDGKSFYKKTYSPKIKEMQHFMGYAFVKTANIWIANELARDPEFKWNSFRDFKSWLQNPAMRLEAVEYYYEHESEWRKKINIGW